MKNTLLLIAAFVFGLCTLHAQSAMHNRPAGYLPGKPALTQDTLKILAVMVEFQEDDHSTTVGNGKFSSIYSKNWGQTIIDPLPHDKAYFEGHLLFAKNYFEKASGGKQPLAYQVLPQVVTVSKEMRDYSPVINSDDYKPLGEFAQEVWTLASQAHPEVDFSQYDLFTIFHAGVGRSVALPGSLGNERDLPSLYIGLPMFQKFFGTGFQGIPVNNGNFKITNSMLLPQTESRELSSFNSKYLFEISTNGLLVSSIASHLGLPDLFNTNTGSSAIGRFGLMDGQAIYGYSGVFPPEPSAWEKIYLGWAQPEVLQNPVGDISIVSRLAATLADTVILKVPISATEYYLIENRQRDVAKNGVTVTMLVNGAVTQKTFEKDTTGFNAISIDSLNGIITDIDEFDWALPGSGLLIWHVDQTVLDTAIASNRINVNKKRRGIRVIEADGIQDIGEKFNTILGDVIENGGEDVDLWYKENDADLYKNEFSKKTRPATVTNSGANTLIKFSDFTSKGNRMSFRVSQGDTLVKPLFHRNLTFSSGYPSFSTAFTYKSGIYSLYLLGDTLYVENNGGGLVARIPQFSIPSPAIAEVNGNLFVVGAYGTSLHYLIYDGVTTDQVSLPIPDGETVSTVPMITELPPAVGASRSVLVGTTAGNIFSATLESRPTILKKFSTGAGAEVAGIAEQQNLTYWLVNDASGKYQLFFNSGELHSGTGRAVRFVLAPSKSNAAQFAILVHENNELSGTHRYRLELLTSSESANPSPSGSNAPVSVKWAQMNSVRFTSTRLITHIAAADLKKDGNSYILFNRDGVLEAYNFNGAKADNFPIMPGVSSLAMNPVAADFEGDEKSEVIVVSASGDLFAYDGGTGKIVTGFPVSGGSALTAPPALFNNNGKIAMVTLSDAGVMTGWELGSVAGTIYWSGTTGSLTNSGSAVMPAFKDTKAGLLPKGTVYNYPNPVYDGITYIRYYVEKDSRISVKIYDLSGDFVAELSDYAYGGSEHETPWDVSGISTGVYLARVEATSLQGEAATAVIKIAVVK